jgi:hypothetical protein
MTDHLRSAELHAVADPETAETALGKAVVRVNVRGVFGGGG